MSSTNKLAQLHKANNRIKITHQCRFREIVAKKFAAAIAKDFRQNQKIEAEN